MDMMRKLFLAMMMIGSATASYSLTFINKQCSQYTRVGSTKTP